MGDCRPYLVSPYKILDTLLVSSIVWLVFQWSCIQIITVCHMLYCVFWRHIVQWEYIILLLLLLWNKLNVLANGLCSLLLCGSFDGFAGVCGPLLMHVSSNVNLVPILGSCYIKLNNKHAPVLVSVFVLVLLCSTLCVGYFC